VLGARGISTVTSVVKVFKDAVHCVYCRAAADLRSEGLVN
jgi:hypothetical protein